MATPPRETLDFSHSIRRSGASEVRIGTEMPAPEARKYLPSTAVRPPLIFRRWHSLPLRIHGDFHEIRAKGGGRPEPRAAPRCLSHHPPVAPSRRQGDPAQAAEQD